MSEKELMTREGSTMLENELRQLKEIERPNIIAMVSEARSHGDLKENAEYHSAKERQAYIEARINALESIALNCEIIDPKQMANKSNAVLFGAVVKLKDLETSKELSFQIVGAFESNVEKKKISVKSPLGCALIGKTVGDVVTVQSPGGTREYEILNIEF